MPQMSPMNWIMLLIFFSGSMIMFNSMIYTSFNYPIKLPKIMKKSDNNWKW